MRTQLVKNVASHLLPEIDCGGIRICITPLMTNSSAKFVVNDAAPHHGLLDILQASMKNPSLSAAFVIGVLYGSGSWMGMKMSIKELSHTRARSVTLDMLVLMG